MAGYFGSQPVPQALRTGGSITATASQTSFATAGYTVGYVDVFLNGVLLDASDYTATNGSDIVLVLAAAASDILTWVSYAPFNSGAVTTGPTDTTANRLLTVGAGHQQLDANLYRRGNVLGTTSQSGGIPTGSLIERGSNANGTYAKFADGTMICTVSAITSDAAGLIDWVFPVSFTYPASPNRPAVSGQVGTTGSNAWRVIFGGIASPGDRVSFGVVSKTDAFVVGNCSIIAIGRWF